VTNLSKQTLQKAFVGGRCIVFLRWDLPPPCSASPHSLHVLTLQTYQQHPWLVHLVAKVLHGDPAAAEFFVVNPFPDTTKPPKGQLRVHLRLLVGKQLSCAIHPPHV
jgi:hypothetical protein